MMDWSHPFINNSGSLSLRGTRRLGDIEIATADRKPCPVCGHPTGDCASDSAEKPATKMPSQINGLEPMVLVEQDIAEERQITPYTKSQVLIHRKGSYIPLSKARELGLVN